MSTSLPTDVEKQSQASKDAIDESRRTFDFDQWATAVKRQMLASLKKREAEQIP
jgi:hypothetical protein